MHILEIIRDVTTILFSVGGAAAFLFVMWPAIRRQNRMADRIDSFLDSPDTKRLVDLIRSVDSTQISEFFASLRKISDTFKGGVVGGIKDLIKNNL